MVQFHELIATCFQDVFLDTMAGVLKGLSSLPGIGNLRMMF